MEERREDIQKNMDDISRRRLASAREARLKKKRSVIIGRIEIGIGTIILAVFAFLFLLPIILTITNSFMSATEIKANYGSVFATTDKGGRVFISKTVVLKFILRDRKSVV